MSAKSKRRGLALPATTRTRSNVTVRRTEGDVAIGFSMGVVPDPTDNFVADFADARASSDTIRLLFGKCHPYTDKIDMLVEVSFARRMFENTLWPTIVGTFLNGLIQFCDVAFEGWQPRPATGEEEADYVPVRANMAKIAYLADEAALDFYMFSTHDVSIILQGVNRGVDVVPVVRVLLSTPLLRAVLVRCRELLGARVTSP